MVAPGRVVLALVSVLSGCDGRGSPVAMLRRLVVASLLTWLVGCTGTAPTVPTSPGSPQPPAQPVTYVVSGIVAEVVDGVSRPLAGRQVFLWIAQPNRGWSQTAVSDENGRYTALVPQARVFAYSWHPPDQHQPCLASAAVDRDTTLNVEVVPAGTPATPPAAASPLVTAFVYETTPQGRVPLRGVSVSVDATWDVWVATTRTDDTGRFYLCRVNTSVQMVVSAGNGYEDWWQSLPGGGDMALEIELKKR